jgi:O-antigen ligase
MEQKKAQILQLLRIQPESISPLYFGLLCLLLISLFFSRFMLTVSILTLTGLLVCSKVYFKTAWFSSKMQLKWLVLPAIVLLWYLVSFVYSEDLTTAINTTKVKSMFVLLPFIFLSLYAIQRKQISYLYHLFLLLAFIGSVWSLLQIPIQKINLAENYARGWVIPTIIHHIRFSLMVAFAAIICWMMIFRQPVQRLLPKYGYTALALFFTAYLHVLAVRSGLIGFYLAGIFLVVLNLANRKKLPKKLAGIAVGLIAIVVAFNTIPSLKSKVNYTFYSLDRFVNANDDRGIYSDNRRLISYQAAISVIQENPIVGVGVGDLMAKVNQFYAKNYPNENMQGVQPHNQYLLTATGIGIPGAIFFLFFNLYILFYHYRKQHWHLVAFNLIFLFSFLVEDTLEMQIGVITYFFFNYLGGFEEDKTTLET